MRFYGIQPSEIYNLEFDDALSLLECIPIIEAQEALVSISVGDFPWMKQESRDRRLKDLNNRAFPRILREERALTTQDLARMMNGG